MDKRAHDDRPTDADDIVARLRVEVDGIIDLICRPARSSGIDVEAEAGRSQRRCEKAPDPSS